MITMAVTWIGIAFIGVGVPLMGDRDQPTKIIGAIMFCVGIAIYATFYKFYVNPPL